MSLPTRVTRPNTGARALIGASLLVIVLGIVAGAVFAILGWPLPASGGEWGFPGFQGIAAAVFGGSGALIAWNRPRHPIGWLLLVAGGVLSALQFAAHYYAIYGLLVHPGAVPRPALGFWYAAWVWLPTVASIASATVLLFPSGHLPSPRWRPAAVLLGLGVVVGTMGFALSPSISGLTDADPNPFPLQLPAAISGPAAGLGMAVVVIGLLASAAGLVARFRRSVGVERQQLKWLALAASVAAVTFGIYAVAMVFGGTQDVWVSAIVAVAFLTIPVAIGIAILRYQLWDIDRLINRTLVYAGLTVVLGAVYGASVLALQALLSSVVHTTEPAVAASTLLVAFLFQPVRRRLQRAVDRRFYRSHYDAQRIADAFAARLREEVELDAVTMDLCRSVDRAMRPESASVWLRHVDAH
jgi:hypothetical protein